MCSAWLEVVASVQGQAVAWQPLRQAHLPACSAATPAGACAWLDTFLMPTLTHTPPGSTCCHVLQITLWRLPLTWGSAQARTAQLCAWTGTGPTGSGLHRMCATQPATHGTQAPGSCSSQGWSAMAWAVRVSKYPQNAGWGRRCHAGGGGQEGKQSCCCSCQCAIAAATAAATASAVLMALHHSCSSIS